MAVIQARPVSDACGDVERQNANVMVLPLSGLFSKHDSPGRHVTATPSHAVLVAADTPYRISFPGAIGDRAITLRFGHTLAPEDLDGRRKNDASTTHGLLPAKAMILRNLLSARSEQTVDELEVETLGLDLLDMSLCSMRTDRSSFGGSRSARRLRALERVKEAVALAPAHKWSIAKLAKIANLSPFHLCRIFRETAGTSIYEYVLQERLAQSLNAVLDCDDDLTSVALDGGFASHSHFTARFRRFFGCTPAALRRVATSGQITELRKIVTARRTSSI
jgi:AraC-like DNA-binding protein